MGQQVNSKQLLFEKHTMAGSLSTKFLRYNVCTLVYLTKGKIVVTDKNRRFVAEAGDLMFFERGIYNVELYSAGETVEKILIYLYEDKLYKALEANYLELRVNPHTEHKCSHCIDDIVKIVPEGELAYFLTMLSTHIDNNSYLKSDPGYTGLKLTELCYLLYAKKHGCVQYKLSNILHPKHLNLKDIVHRCLLVDMTIEEIASQCNISPSSFKKEFNKHYKTSPHKWIIEQRLRYSEFMLMSTSKDILEISRKCCFSNSSHYIKKFKLRYGITPNQYRESMQQAVQNGERAGQS